MPHTVTDLETRVTDWHSFGHYGLTHYRIWQRQTLHGMFQRHEWKREDGSTDLQDWIPSTQNWTAGASLVMEAA